MNPHGIGYKEILEAAAATWATTDDIMESDLDLKEFQISPNFREITAIGFVGSDAALDTQLQVKVGNVTTTIVRNSNTTDFNKNEDLKPISVPIPPGTPVQMKISAQSTTNGFLVALRIGEHEMQKVASALKVKDDYRLNLRLFLSTRR